MKAINSLLIGVCFLAFVSCVPAEKQDTVIVETTGIEEIPTVEISNEGVLGEFLIDSETVTTSIILTNNSEYELFDIGLEFERSFESNGGMDFSKNEFGESIFPGNGGTCERTLSPQENCIIRIQFEPDRRGDFYQFIDIKYKNMIDEITYKVEYFARVGEYASIGFEQGSSIFNFGSLNRDGVNRGEQEITLVNNGGLTAKNISFILSNQIKRIDKKGIESIEEISNGFYIKENTCSKDLSLREKCSIVIDYSNSNVLLDDPDLNYSGILTIRYEKDTAKSMGLLNANLGFSSTAKEANFIFSGLENVKSYSVEVTGTKSDPPETLIIQNDGYANGFIKKFIFYDESNNEMASCESIDEGSGELLCLKPNGVSAALSEIPFKIYNYEDCLNRPVKMKEVGRAGEKCHFNLVYWPSAEFEKVSNNSYKKLSLAVEFDSQLQGDETIKRKRISQISYNFKKPALLVITGVKIDGATIEESIDYESQDNLIGVKFGKYENETDAFFNLGKYTLVNSEDIRKKVTVTIRNIGETSATITSIRDSQYSNGSDGYEIPLRNYVSPNSPFDIPYSNTGLSTFYKDVETTCPDKIFYEPCEISFYLNLKKQFPVSEGNKVLFFDHIGNTSFIANDVSFKQFNFFYENGSQYNDDGSPYEAKRTKVRLGGEIVNKAILKFVNTPSWSKIEDISYKESSIPYIFGNKALFNIYVTNIGTNDASYMYFSGTDNLNRNQDSGCTAFNIQDIPEGLVGNYGLSASENLDGTGEIIPSRDCYDIIDYTREGFLTTSGVSINQLSVLEGNKRVALKEGETCVMQVLIEPMISKQGCLKNINYSDYADKNTAFDYGIAKQDLVDEFLKFPFTSKDVSTATPGDDELKFLAPPKHNSLDATIGFKYFDGDLNSSFLPENKSLTDRFIYGEEAVVVTDEILRVSYAGRGNIFIKDVSPMMTTLLLRESSDYLAYNGTLSPFASSIPDTYVRHSSLNDQLNDYNALQEIFQKNVDYHHSLAPFSSSGDWRVFLGAYPKNDESNNYFHFSLEGLGGYGEAKIVKCKIESDFGTFELEDSSTYPDKGIIPHSNFATKLSELGCDFSGSTISTNLFKNDFQNLLEQDYMLKYIPDDLTSGDKDHFFRITFTIQDGLNPNNSLSIPERSIVFDFTAKTVDVVDSGICLSPEGGCSSGGDTYTINAESDLVQENIVMKASQGNSVEHEVEIYNNNSREISPKIFLKDGVTSKYLNIFPNEIDISSDCAVIAANSSCIVTLSFSPNQGSPSSSFLLEIAYDSLNIGPSGYSQHRFVKLPFETVVLENGQIVPYKLATVDGVETCSEEKLSNMNVSYEGSEPRVVVLPFGQLSFDHVLNGTYKTFCIRNPKTLPVLIYDYFENWLPETVDGRDNFVRVSTSTSGDVIVYVEEKCLLQSMEVVDSVPVLKSSPDNADEYGIKNDDHCLITTFFKPSPSFINSEVDNNTFSIFNYFANYRNGSEPPVLVRGVKPNAKILSPESIPESYVIGDDRSVYQIETDYNSMNISWKPFSYQSSVGSIDKYLVFVDRNFSNIDDNDYIKNNATNPTVPVCNIPSSPDLSEYSCEVTGLSSGSRYYARVVPVIRYLGFEFIAFDRGKTNTQVFYTTFNDDSLAYDYANNIYIDKHLIFENSGSGSYEEASQVCAQSEFNISVSLSSGRRETLVKSQISLDQWAVILSDIEKYNSETIYVQIPIWLAGEVSHDFEGIDLSYASGTSYQHEIEGYDYYFYFFDWDGDIPDSFIIATDELPYDNDAPPVYGSLQLKESDGGIELNTRCYTNLQE